MSWETERIAQIIKNIFFNKKILLHGSSKCYAEFCAQTQPTAPCHKSCRGRAFQVPFISFSPLRGKRRYTGPETSGTKKMSTFKTIHFFFQLSVNKLWTWNEQQLHSNLSLVLIYFTIITLLIILKRQLIQSICDLPTTGGRLVTRIKKRLSQELTVEGDPWMMTGFICLPANHCLLDDSLNCKMDVSMEHLCLHAHWDLGFPKVPVTRAH